jgi:hypothetical protein
VRREKQKIQGLKNTYAQMQIHSKLPNLGFSSPLHEVAGGHPRKQAGGCWYVPSLHRISEGSHRLRVCLDFRLG